MRQQARARDLGVVIGDLDPGTRNAITDVAGVGVGHTTLIEGADIRTGVTAVVPAGVLPVTGCLPAAVAVGNGHGKFIGATQIAELGVIETPILLTATLSAFRAADALVGHMLSLAGYESVQSINPVVGETNDGFLSNIRARPVTAGHVVAALTSATAGAVAETAVAEGAVAEGSVGAGTGTGALGFKAGIGTSSRVLRATAGEARGRDGTPVTVAALVQANFSGTLVVSGVPIPAPPRAGPGPAGHDGNSCIIVVATDAAVDARQLGRVARRALAGLVRVGSDLADGSGDYALAFSTVPPGAAVIPDTSLGPLFTATIDCVHEALLNSLCMAGPMTGYRGHTMPAVPHHLVRAASAAGRRAGDGGFGPHQRPAGQG